LEQDLARVNDPDLRANLNIELALGDKSSANHNGEQQRKAANYAGSFVKRLHLNLCSEKRAQRSCIPSTRRIGSGFSAWTSNAVG
jgi:hypothetical protein